MKRLEIKVLVFILGFSLVYVFLGVSVAFVGPFFRLNMNWLFTIAGVILIVFGLHVMHVLRIKWLEVQLGGINRAEEATDLVGAFLVGVAFAIGWSPCTGPIVAGILVLAAQQHSVMDGGVLLLFYCIGLGIPFMLVGLAVGKFLRLFEKLQRHFRKVEIGSGILLILIGLLFLTQNANIIREIMSDSLGIATDGFQRALAPNIGEGVSLFAIGASLLAGFLSFISPCVLPLLPSYVAFIAGAEVLDQVYAEENTD